MSRIGLDYKKTLSSVPAESEEYESAVKECHQRSADKLLKLCTDNGGCFIKV